MRLFGSHRWIKARVTLCTRLRVNRTCSLRCWRLCLVFGFLTQVCQMVYITSDTVYFNRVGHRGDFDRIIDKAQKMRSEQRNHTQPNATVAVVPHNASQATDSADAAMGLFRNLSTSPYRVLAGNVRKQKGHLAIGIPSARRAHTNVIYLLHTLRSLVRATSDTDKTNTTIIVMLTGTNNTYKSQISNAIYRDFQSKCDTGFIIVIELSQEVYPDLNRVKETFNDSRPRLSWRAKQNIDFAYLFYYCRGISKYYLQLEDDVIAANNFLYDIDKFISKQSSEWFLLEFSYLGFIGKLFKSSDVEWVANYLLKRYEEAPCDLLLFSMLEHRKQQNGKRLINKPSLFQHIGKFSTLNNKIMPAIDAFFKEKRQVQAEVDEVPDGVYPAAELETSLEVYMDHGPSRAYDNILTTYFWGKTHIKGDYFMIKFEQPQNFSRILVLSGHPDLYIDRFTSSYLLVSTKANMAIDNSIQARCKDFSKLVMLVDGQADTLATGTGIPRDILCLKIAFTTASRARSILREIRLVL